MAIYGIVVLYAAFDRWAEYRSKGTLLTNTILTIALLREVFSPGHFNVLLLLSAILIALLADLSRFNLRRSSEDAAQAKAGKVLDRKSAAVVSGHPPVFPV